MFSLKPVRVSQHRLKNNIVYSGRLTIETHFPVPKSRGVQTPTLIDTVWVFTCNYTCYVSYVLTSIDLNF